jgi:cytochrome c-type biogenesis protein CcmH/NrfG
MIRTMGERLAARLRADGSDPDGWVRLVRSYKVLDDRAKMEAAIADARRALAVDAAKLAQFEDGLKSLDAEPAVAVQSPPAPAAAAPAASAADQDRMILGMVERLAARLRADGSDVGGWIMLVRSYLALGERERARDAVTAARGAVGGNAESLRRLEDGLKSLGFQG